MLKLLPKTIFAVIFLLSSCFCVFSQTAGTDTLSEGKSYYEVNLWTGTQSQANGGTQIYGGRFAYGLSKRVEVGLGASFSDPNDPEYPPEIQPSLKYKFYENEKYGVKVAGGVVGYIPVAKRAGTDAFAYVYTNVSKDVEKLNGARFTVGGYTLLARNKDFGSRKGWNLMYEQPINSKVAFSAQWVTGKNRFGYVTSGFSLTLPKKSSLFIGYSVGNYDYDNHGPFVSYGILR